MKTVVDVGPDEGLGTENPNIISASALRGPAHDAANQDGVQRGSRRVLMRLLRRSSSVICPRLALGRPPGHLERDFPTLLVAEQMATGRTAMRSHG
jgi:hypothetical protein